MLIHSTRMDAQQSDPVKRYRQDADIDDGQLDVANMEDE